MKVEIFRYLIDGYRMYGCWFDRALNTPVCKATLLYHILHGCSPVNLLHIFGTSFPEKTSGGLFL